MEPEKINLNVTSDLSFNDAVKTFFKDNTPDSVKVLFWKLFQCWVTRDCNVKADLSDQEIALFFDQLIDLVAAAHIVHQANRALDAGQEGNVNE